MTTCGASREPQQETIPKGDLVQMLGPSESRVGGRKIEALSSSSLGTRGWTLTSKTGSGS